MITVKSYRWLLLFILCFVCLSSLFAQTDTNPSGNNCQEPVESGYGTPGYDPNLGWAPGTTVLVNVNTAGMTTDQVNAITQAFDNWKGVGNVNLEVYTNNSSISTENPGTFVVDASSAVTSQNATLEGGPGSNGHYYNAHVTLNSNDISNLTLLTKLMSHEIGHTFGLDDAADGNSPSVMADHCDLTTSSCGSEGPTLTDMAAADCEDGYTQNSCIDPGNSDNPACQCGAGTSGDCSGGLTCQSGTCGCTDPCDDGNCPGYVYQECCTDQCDLSCNPYASTDPSCAGNCAGEDKPGCPTAECEDGEWTCADSPIVIDVKDEGFHLTSAQNGVEFDFSGDGTKVWLAWTDPAFSNAWLALDRNGNGTIDNAKELFGNITPQPFSESPNGFLALAEYDKRANGGNGDGFIDEHDAIYPKLLLWIDANHNGISEPDELHSLKEFGVARIDLHFKESDRVDQYGNLFRYRARVLDKDGKQGNRWTYDVFLQQSH